MPVEILIDEGLNTPEDLSETIALAYSKVATVPKRGMTASPERRDVCIRVCDADFSQALNLQFRQQDKPTNVLSFPASFTENDWEVPDGESVEYEDLAHMLGDVALCWPVIQMEAHQQEKGLDAHLSHLTIHGVLHLLGYDHVEPQEASHMEDLERTLLAALGLPDPY